LVKMERWRFIDTGPLDGPSNMALDEALLTSFNPVTSQPVFRLYGWSPPAFSIGRFQDVEATLDLGKCRDSGVDTVRRMTAGGIIYHADEITYSLVCAPRHIPCARSVKNSYKKLSGFLLLSYIKLGLNPAFAVDVNPAAERLGQRTPLCFAGREEYDIVIDGRKIGGNAQRRTKGVIFQHGSIPLRNCLPEALRFVYEHVRPDMLEENTVSLGELRVTSNTGTLVNMLAESFEKSLEATLLRSELAEDEIKAAENLRINKYSRNSWNREGGRE
jgi:lipoate-protein ligase A